MSLFFDLTGARQALEVSCFTDCFSSPSRTSLLQKRAISAGKP